MIPNVKPAITSIDEFLVADKGAELFEKSAGTLLHRDPTTNKCKFLPLGKWRKKLRQCDIPTDYMRITDTLEMVGVELCCSWAKSRQKNGMALRSKLDRICGAWRSGIFMNLTLLDSHFSVKNMVRPPQNLVIFQLLSGYM